MLLSHISGLSAVKKHEQEMEITQSAGHILCVYSGVHILIIPEYRRSKHCEECVNHPYGQLSNVLWQQYLQSLKIILSA